MQATDPVACLHLIQAIDPVACLHLIQAIDPVACLADTAEQHLIQAIETVFSMVSTLAKTTITPHATCEVRCGLNRLVCQEGSRPA